MVEYQISLENAPVIQRLDQCFSRGPTLLEEVTTLVWDNSLAATLSPRVATTVSPSLVNFPFPDLFGS
jgi:hypothetical protein